MTCSRSLYKKELRAGLEISASIQKGDHPTLCRVGFCKCDFQGKDRSAEGVQHTGPSTGVMAFSPI